MKIAFSTIGCPGWSWKEIFATAKDLGYNGIEIRGIESNIFAPDAAPFTPSAITETVEMLSKSSLCIPVLDTGACLGTGNYEENINEAKAYIDLAKKINCKYIRVMISPNPEPTQADLDIAKKAMIELCEYAGDNISVLIETNGVFCDTKKLAEFMDSVDMPNSGVLWDIHHPYRHGGEAIEKTFENLKKYIKHIHVKDSVLKDGVVHYRMMGYGDIPVFDALKLLSDNNFNGFVSLEWVKRWKPDLQEAGIVFAHFANYINCLINQL